MSDQTSSHLPEWQLPRGVTRGLWQYAQADYIADDYDDYFAFNQLFDFDEEILSQAFVQPGTLVDLGCGTGRLLMPFARRGFHTVGVDLSRQMLAVVEEKACLGEVEVDLLRANMVELDCLQAGVADYCISMFSTLGMIRGAKNRQQALAHVYRILRPGGRFAVHVHNRWFNVFEPRGRWWLAATTLGGLVRRDLDAGDKVFDYRGVKDMFLHTFSYHEITAALASAGLRIDETVPLDVGRQRRLRQPWFLGRFRANGWIFLCSKPG